MDTGGHSMLTTASHSWSVETMVRQVARGGLPRLPGLDDREPWDVVAMSRYVESAILGLPLGQIVLLGDRPLRSGVVDGRRRLSALALFVGVVPPWRHDGGPGFALTGTQIASQLEGMTFESLSRDQDLLVAFENHGGHVVRLIAADGIDLALLRERAQGAV